VTFFHHPLKEYRVFKDGIPCFQGRNTVFSRTEYRVFKDGIPCFQGRNTVFSRTGLASPQSWDNVY
jgi:hypothetical protein